MHWSTCAGRLHSLCLCLCLCLCLKVHLRPLICEFTTWSVVAVYRLRSLRQCSQVQAMKLPAILNADNLYCWSWHEISWTAPAGPKQASHMAGLFCIGLQTISSRSATCGSLYRQGKQTAA